MMSWDRGASMTRIARRSVTAMRAVRSPRRSPRADRAPAGEGDGRLGRGAAEHLLVLRRPRPARALVLEQMLAGVSTRRFSRTREPVGRQVAAAERSTLKSAVSRELVAHTGEHLAGLMGRRL